MMRELTDLKAVITAAVVSSIRLSERSPGGLEQQEQENDLGYFDRLLKRVADDDFTELEDTIETIIYEELDRILHSEMVLIQAEELRSGSSRVKTTLSAVIHLVTGCLMAFAVITMVRKISSLHWFDVLVIIMMALLALAAFVGFWIEASPIIFSGEKQKEDVATQRKRLKTQREKCSQYLDLLHAEGVNRAM